MIHHLFQEDLRKHRFEKQNCALCHYGLNDEEVAYYETHQVVGNYDHEPIPLSNGESVTPIKNLCYVGGYYCESCAEIVSNNETLLEKFTRVINLEEFDNE